MEISLEKSSIFDGVGDDILLNFFKQIGIRKEQVEGVQLVPPKTPKKVFVWIVPGVDLNQFCYSESFKLSENVRTGVIKPMDKR